MVGRRKLPDPLLNHIFLMLYRLVYNVRSHFNELILAFAYFHKNFLSINLIPLDSRSSHFLSSIL